MTPFRGMAMGLLLGLSSLSALAQPYTRIVPEKSRIAFVYRQMNVPMEGQFKRFTGQLSFDPTRLELARAQLDIELASFDSGAADADEEVRGKLWFNTREFPRAQFLATSVRSVGAQRFEISGKLSMKGRTRDLVLPVSLRQEGALGVFEGSAAINRADFGIGEGVWADYGTVANAVQIRFQLVAARDK